MKLDRALIKSQARQLIKGRVFILFLITFVVTLLANGATFTYNFNNNVDLDALKNFSSDSKNIGGINDLEDYLNDFDDYLDNGNDGSEEAPVPKLKKSGFKRYFARLGGIVSLACAPLMILLCGVYLMLIRGNAPELYDEFSYVFRNTFDKNYFNKFLLMLLKGIFTFLWSLLLIVPGIVYAYKIYFAEFIQAEYPELTWKDSLELSKKITRDHKGELFVFDLSFIPWYLLMIITLGFAGIYIMPYYFTAKALFYENFKLRALQTGVINETDFMTEAQKYAKFVSENPAPAGQSYYQPLPKAPQNNYSQPQQNAYPQYAPVPPQQPTYAPAPVYSQPAPPQAPAVPQEAPAPTEKDNETL